MSFASLGISYVLFCTAHWVFAMKYFTISIKLSLYYQFQPIKKYDSALASINYWMIFLNILIPILEAILEGLDDPTSNEVAFKTSFYLLIFIQVASCIALFDACRRIVVVVGKNSQEIEVNV